MVEIQTLERPEVQALKDTLDDEYKSRETYAQVIRDFGAVRPFINIVEAEARHASALLDLFKKYAVSPPANRWAGNAPRRCSFVSRTTRSFRDRRSTRTSTARSYRFFMP